MKSRKFILMLLLIVTLSTLLESCASGCQRRKRRYFKRYVQVEQPVHINNTKNA